VRPARGGRSCRSRRRRRNRSGMPRTRPPRRRARQRAAASSDRARGDPAEPHGSRAGAYRHVRAGPFAVRPGSFLGICPCCHLSPICHRLPRCRSLVATSTPRWGEPGHGGIRGRRVRAVKARLAGSAGAVSQRPGAAEQHAHEGRRPMDVAKHAATARALQPFPLPARPVTASRTNASVTRTPWRLPSRPELVQRERRRYLS
jgi:hypothetical protein